MHIGNGIYPYQQVKGRGGSGYVVKKDSLVLEKRFNRN